MSIGVTFYKEFTDWNYTNKEELLKELRKYPFTYRWAKYIAVKQGIHVQTIYNRFNRGWSIERIEEYVKPKDKKKYHNSKYITKEKDYITSGRDGFNALVFEVVEWYLKDELYTLDEKLDVVMPLLESLRSRRTKTTCQFCGKSDHVMSIDDEGYWKCNACWDRGTIE